MSQSSEDPKTGSCEVCQQSAARRCSACKLVFYCSEDHQKSHWKEHKNVCRPFEVARCAEVGRYLKATRDLNPSDIIFTDTPIVFGPKPHRVDEGQFPCVGCCRLLDDQTCHRCPGCFWPVCKPDCQGIKVATLHGFECNILRLRPPSEAKSFYEYYRFDVLIILRALYLQKTNVKKWETMLSLQDHLRERGPNSKVYKSIEEKIYLLQQNYLDPLRNYEKETGQSVLPPVTSEVIHKIYGILDVNATELTEDIDGVILYPTASLMEHNCIPNTVQMIDEKDNLRVTYKAALPIKKDEHITTMYTHILWGTSARRHHLRKTKYFTCKCKRCQDPTELGTYLSALKCLGTENEPCGGVQLPINPTESNCEWACNKCGIKLPNKEIMKFVHHLNGEVEKMMAKRPKVEELEDILGKLLKFLHPNHYLVYSIKHSLVQLYGNEGGIEASSQLLSEKQKMCEELIAITRRLDPGNARLSLYLGVLLNELFIAKFKLFSRNFDAEKKGEFSDTVKDIENILEENKLVLQHEIGSTAGSKLLEVVCQNEAKFKNWMDSENVNVV
ncbi:hypothetical protein NQ318_022712 [Aromia moschata]|uniref:Protein msta n=1 Tax=Aromia moschata TaxID=1265417 RepID=A0AAV8YB39_9CUCU|nr:hypothetical protein NQ318_022712 [Aromia moschata]